MAARNGYALVSGRTADPRGLSYADATTGTINALYTPASVPRASPSRPLVRYFQCAGV
ncbi:hypothetical protein JHV675_51430 [Mycobacterium avium subsp. hominissuis]